MAGQAAFAVALLALTWFLARNLVTNMRAQGLSTDFSYLEQPAGFQISGSPFRAGQPVHQALVVGIRNTAAAALAGIVLTTVIGTVVGVARLSSNWLVRRAAAIYVEALRNLPPLLVILFALLAVMLRLPRLDRAVDVGGLLVLTVKGVGVVTPRAAAGFAPFVGIVTAALVAAFALGAWRTRVWNRTGRPHHRLALGAVVLAAAGAVGYAVLGGPVEVSRPVVGARTITGGIVLRPEFAAILAGLVLYTASHVAEIVRGSIQAVPRGQNEAAMALGLSGFQRLRFVVLPQAFRIAIPPVINQYLNLTKNTSLGIVIGYAEVTAVTFIVIGNGNPAPQNIAVLMGVYLVFSLAISAVVNLVNRRLELQER